ncbi:MAG: dienelactone hydrolase family protein, partial [Acidobacteria bacterium]|nr:dienelactone hydrolase family protein [Acidobacteriota bacterium]
MRGAGLLVAALLFRVLPVLESAPPPTLAGTLPIEVERGELPARMVAGIDRFLTRRLADSPSARKARWHPDFSLPERYQASVDGNRARLRMRIGAADKRLPAADSLVDDGAPVSAGASFTVRRVRWPVFEGLTGAGLLLVPAGRPVAGVIAIPDAGWTPEALAGLEPGVSRVSQFARRLAESGCLVLVPTVIDRTRAGDIGSSLRETVSQSRREVIYRMAFELGRHIIGFEVQKVLAGVDWFERSSPGLPVGVFGYGEGGLLALHSAALDPRIRAAGVSGYFSAREQVWREPIYRNVWKLLEEFGDAEIAGLIAPRRLVVEPSRGPEVGPNSGGDTQGAAPGFLAGPLLGEVIAEFDRGRTAFTRLGAVGNLVLAMHEIGRDEPGSSVALEAFLKGLGGTLKSEAGSTGVTAGAAPRDSATRQQAQFQEMVAYCQTLLARSGEERRRYWAAAKVSTAGESSKSSGEYRRELWEEIFGKLAVPAAAAQPRTRLAYERPGWSGYEVWIPVLPEVFAYGELLIPKGMRPGERRPVVVTQHGRAGHPGDLIDPRTAVLERVYKRLAVQLVERGFVVYAPQNPYIFEEQYRFLQRKANPLGLSLFSFILAQHQRTLEWLGKLPRFVRNFMDGSASVQAAVQRFVEDVKAGRFSSDSLHGYLQARRPRRG